MSQFYVYLHRKKTNGEVFYIGKGKHSKEGYRKYIRSKTPSGRNEHWRRIVNKYGFDIELYIDNVLEEEALRVEAELIDKYKTWADGGTLCNIYKSDNKHGVRHSRCKKVYAYDSNGLFHSEYQSVFECSISLGLIRANVGKCLKGERKSVSGYMLFFEHQGESITQRPLQDYTKYVYHVYNKLTGELLQSFNGAEDCSKFLGVTRDKIASIASDRHKTYKQYFLSKRLMTVDEYFNKMGVKKAINMFFKNSNIDNNYLTRKYNKSLKEIANELDIKTSVSRVRPILAEKDGLIEEFNSIMEFCSKYNTSAGNAHMVLNNKRNYVSGFKLKYKL